MRTASGIRIYMLNAYAKLNLYLDITGKRDDGYHLLETVMQSISLADEVTVVVSAGNGITLSVSRERMSGRTMSRSTMISMECFLFFSREISSSSS